MLTVIPGRTFRPVSATEAAAVAPPTVAELRAHKGDDSAAIGRRWVPIAHAEVLDRLPALGSVEDTRVYLTRDNHGLLATGRLPGLATDPDAVPAFALWHDNLQRRAMSIAAGASVLVCENGMLTGEYRVRRKHTTGAHLDSVFNRFGAVLRESAAGQAREFAALRASALDDPAADLFALAARAALPSAFLPEAWYHFVNPTHEEFRDGGSAWCWYQAVNTAAKRLAPDTQTRALAGAWSIVSAALLN